MAFEIQVGEFQHRHSHSEPELPGKFIAWIPQSGMLQIWKERLGNRAGKSPKERRCQHCTFLKSSAEPGDATFPSLPIKNPGDGAWFQPCQGVIQREQSWLAAGNSHIQDNTVGRGAMDAVAMLTINQPILFIWDQIHPVSFPSVSWQDGNDILFSNLPCFQFILSTSLGIILVLSSSGCSVGVFQ